MRVYQFRHLGRRGVTRGRMTICQSALLRPVLPSPACTVPMLDHPAMHGRHTFKAIDVQHEGLVAASIRSAGKRLDAAIAAELMIDLVRIETVGRQTVGATLDTKSAAGTGCMIQPNRRQREQLQSPIPERSVMALKRTAPQGHCPS